MGADTTATIARLRVNRPLASAATLIALALSSGVAAGAAPAERDAPRTIEIQVDLGAPRQVIQGFGTSNRVWNDPHVAIAAVSVPVAAQRRS